MQQLFGFVYNFRFAAAQAKKRLNKDEKVYSLLL